MVNKMKKKQSLVDRKSTLFGWLALLAVMIVGTWVTMQLIGDSTFFDTLAANRPGTTVASKQAIELARQKKIDARQALKTEKLSPVGPDGCPINVSQSYDKTKNYCTRIVTTWKYHTYENTIDHSFFGRCDEMTPHIDESHPGACI
jgi:hypothetical protein